MAKIVSKRSLVERVTYARTFQRVAGVGGFAFDCDATGRPLRPEHASRIAELIADPARYRDTGIAEYRSHWYEPAVIACDGCGAHVALHGFTNACDCGADYNMSGQRLAPRAHWGEETGESATEILLVG